MKKINMFLCILLMPIIMYAQAQDEFIFENGDDNVVFVETIELNRTQAFVPAGLYFGWMLSRDLQSDMIVEYADYTLEDFNSKESTGPELFMTDWEGVLSGELMNEDVYRFSKTYFSSGDYEKDLQTTFELGTSSIYSIEDTWENFAKIQAVIDQKYRAWQAQRRTR